MEGIRGRIDLDRFNEVTLAYYLYHFMQYPGQSKKWSDLDKETRELYLGLAKDLIAAFIRNKIFS